MKSVEINLSGLNLEGVKSLCASLSERFSSCSLFQYMDYWSEEGNLVKSSYGGIKEEQGYGIKVLIEEDNLNRLEKILRVQLSGSDLKWVQVLVYEIDTHHVNLG